MYTLLLTLVTIISIFLIIIVLMQSSKGGGLAGTFGGAGFGTMFGARRTADFLSKATWWLGGTLLVLAIVINLFFLPTEGTRESIIQRSKVSPSQQMPPAQQQQAPQQQQQQK